MRRLICAAAFVCVVVATPSDADACGGCFHPVAETGPSVVTDHRMVFKLSKTETILWDQIRYSGEPQEFAWVLPVREGATIELSRDEWLAALDSSTRSTVTGPERSCGGGGARGSSSLGCSSTTTETTTTLSARDAGGVSGNHDVQVVAQSVVGPYQAVTLRATGTQGIADWLAANGFAIPAEVRPTVDAYTREKFDFIALRLRPGEGVNAMRPVRVVARGADPTLPLRMVAAGVGGRVGLTLWVVAEGRYHPQNFPDAQIDDAALTWDGASSRSNLGDLETVAMSANDGRTWITQAAIHATALRVPRTTFPANPLLSDAYRRTCVNRPYRLVSCSEDDLPPSDGTPDDAGSGCTKEISGCDGFDDDTVAMRDLFPPDVWITRLRADLPVTALATDLQLEAAPQQDEFDPQHHTETFGDPKFDPCAGVSSDDDGCACRTMPSGRSAGSSGIVALAVWAASRFIRRRR